MPKLPALTAKKFIKIISKQGYKLNRITGSHHIFVNLVNKSTLAIPVHAGKDLGKGLLKSLLKQAKISEADFLKLL